MLLHFATVLSEVFWNFVQFYFIAILLNLLIYTRITILAIVDI